jgi:hypothetical protein
MVARGAHERLRIHGRATRSARARSDCLTVFAVAIHFPSSLGVEAIKSLSIRFGSTLE